MPVGAGIGAASLIGSAIKSHQASKAANAQIAAQREALQTQAKMYDQTRQDLSPFRLGGQAAFGKLGNFLGLPAAPPDTAPRQGPAPPTAAQTAVFNRSDPRFQQFVGDASQIQMPGMPGYAAAIREMPGVKFTPARPQGSMVQMRAPTGQMKAVPQDQVAHYEQMGAVRV